MSFSQELQNALRFEKARLEIAESFARLHHVNNNPQYKQGRNDRLNGEPCKSANGQYLDGWYSI